MGYSSALDMAGRTDRRTAVEWHCKSNCFPPFPDFMVDVAVMAIEAMENNDATHIVDLPHDTEYRGKNGVEAYHIVDAMRLDAFLVDIDSEEDW